MLKFEIISPARFLFPGKYLKTMPNSLEVHILFKTGVYTEIIQ